MKFEAILTTALLFAVSEADPGLKGLSQVANEQAGLLEERAVTKEAMVDTELAIKTMARSRSTTLSRTSSLDQLKDTDLARQSVERAAMLVALEEASKEG
jgi:hypothetical protein